jgi:hypothetical protein
MDQVRNEFSTAVHSTLAEVARPAGSHESHAAKVCPPAAAALYGRALAAGGRYLAIGHEMESRFREIRRADELGDASGLTPGLSAQGQEGEPDSPGHAARPARDARRLLRATGRRAAPRGCDLRAPGASPARPLKMIRFPTDPSNPAAWALDDTGGRPRGQRHADPSRTVRTPPKTSAPPTTAPAVWIEIDNSHCARPSQLQIDGRSYGALPGHKRTSVRTHAGPHESACCPARRSTPAASPAPCARCTSTKAGRSRFAAIGPKSC